MRRSWGCSDWRLVIGHLPGVRASSRPSSGRERAIRGRGQIPKFRDRSRASAVASALYGQSWRPLELWRTGCRRPRCSALLCGILFRRSDCWNIRFLEDEMTELVRQVLLSGNY
jgi:hypothetical protein